MLEKFIRNSAISLIVVVIATSCSSENTQNSANVKTAAVEHDSLSQKQQFPKDTLEQRLINLGLVDVQALNPDIFVDLKYSSEDNFMKTNVYGKLKKAYLQKEIAEMLSQAQKELTKKNRALHLLVYDAVRPRWVQYKMWDLLDTIPVFRRSKFVSNPRNGSVHNYGAAIDLTICDQNGKPFDMGAKFDEPREIAYPSKEQHFFELGLLNKEQIQNRKLLRQVMKLAGFYNLDTEWWHFNGMTRNAAKERYEIIP
jgi:D-alanyl-D-alanine dipeptidase